MVRDATTEVVEGMIQLTDTILNAPVERLSFSIAWFCGNFWEKRLEKVTSILV